MLAVGGPDDATFALACDRGTTKLSLSLDRGQPVRIAAFQVVSRNHRAAERLSYAARIRARTRAATLSPPLHIDALALDCA